MEGNICRVSKGNPRRLWLRVHPSKCALSFPFLLSTPTPPEPSTLPSTLLRFYLHHYCLRSLPHPIFYSLIQQKPLSISTHLAFQPFFSCSNFCFLYRQYEAFITRSSVLQNLSASTLAHLLSFRQPSPYRFSVLSTSSYLHIFKSVLILGLYFNLSLNASFYITAMTKRKQLYFLYSPCKFLLLHRLFLVFFDIIHY